MAKYSISYGYHDKSGSYGSDYMGKVEAINEAMAMVSRYGYHYVHVYWHGDSGISEKLISFYEEDF